MAVRLRTKHSIAPSFSKEVTRELLAGKIEEMPHKIRQAGDRQPAEVLCCPRDTPIARNKAPFSVTWPPNSLELTNGRVHPHRNGVLK
jgi:hypothetical protein